MKLKEKIYKILPANVYSLCVRYSKVILSIKNMGIKRRKMASEKKILIVKTDAIGDYIVFRNFIKEIKKSPKYKNYKLYLLGNNVWKNLYNKLDSSFFQDSFFINRNFLYKKKYIKKLIRRMNEKRFEIIIHPVCHRDFTIDYLIRNISSEEKITFSGYSMNQGKLEMNFTDKFYSKLIETKDKLEFDRNRTFFEQFLNKKINLHAPLINLHKKQNNYFVINPGASIKLKQWAPENFAKTINHLVEKYNAKIYIVGSASELELDKKVKTLSKYQNNIEIKNGGTLFDLLKLIAGSRGVVSNETCTTHMAIALKKKVYCVVNGVGHQSVYPYPNYKNAIYFYPKSFKKHNKSKSDINTINPNQIIHTINF